MGTEDCEKLGGNFIAFKYLMPREQKAFKKLSWDIFDGNKK